MVARRLLLRGRRLKGGFLGGRSALGGTGCHTPGLSSSARPAGSPRMVGRGMILSLILFRGSTDQTETNKGDLNPSTTCYMILNLPGSY